MLFVDVTVSIQCRSLLIKNSFAPLTLIFRIFYFWVKRKQIQGRIFDACWWLLTRVSVPEMRIWSWTPFSQLTTTSSANYLCFAIKVDYSSSSWTRKVATKLRHLNLDPYPSRTPEGPWVTLVHEATHSTMRMSSFWNDGNDWLFKHKQGRRRRGAGGGTCLPTFKSGGGGSSGFVPPPPHFWAKQMF